MPPISIENPILNSPFAEPARHFKFDDDGITSENSEGRRRSTYFISIAEPQVKGGAQLTLPGDWVGERTTELSKELEHLLPVIASSGGPREEPSSVTP